MEHFPAQSPRVGVFRESPGSDIIQSGFLKKLKTMKKKYFILRSTSTSGPARLEYHDNEKKFKQGHAAKRTIHLHHCFNINKKSDTKHKFAVALFLKEECFSLVFEDEESQERWLDSLLKYQNEYLLEGESPKPHYDFVWQGLVKPPQKVLPKCVKISGTYRLCLSEKSVFLVKIGHDNPEFTFQFSTVRRCGHSDNYFFLEVGRQASTGPGEMWMQVEDSATAESMHSSVLHYMTAARSSQPDQFRRRSNTSSSAVVAHHRNTVIGDEFQRQRTASESHHGSPRRNRITVSRPISTVEFASKQSITLSPEPQSMLPPGSSPISPSFMEPPFDESRIRSDSVGSRGSRSSRASSHHTDVMDSTPVHTPENSMIYRSQTPESTYPISEEETSDYLNMTPGQRSGSPSPTRERIERPGSSGSEGQELKMDGYMDMKPGSSVSSTGNDSGYMDMHVGGKTSESTGYMLMGPGQGPGRATAPIPIHPAKESTGYMDMVASGLTSQTQTLPTVKESGSGEAYLPMTPTGQSPMSSCGLKPARVVSYLSDDSMSGEFPKRAYSVGSRPTTKPLRHHHLQDIQKKEVLDSRSSSAPHLIVQKSRSPYLDSSKYPNPYDAYLGASPLSQSYKSDDSDSFMEMDFYRPRTASDSYGCRPRASSFGKQYTTQGHRPRSSSYGQASRGKLSKLDSMDSVRMTSQELHTGIKPNSEESLGKFSSSSRNSSSDSLKKIPDDAQKNLLSTDYMDMGFEKRNSPSPNVQNFMSPPKSEKDITGYVDMTLGTSAPKSSRGVSPSSSNHSLGSSPASSSGRSHDRSQKSQDAVVVKASGHVVHKPGFSASENQLKVTSPHLMISDKRSPSSSGKESEDESYVPFQPAAAQQVMSKPYVTGHDIGAKGHLPKDTVQRSGAKIQHGYSRSLDSGMKIVDNTKTHHGLLDKVGKKKHDGKHKSKAEDDHHRANKHGKHSSPKPEASRSKSKSESAKADHTLKAEGGSSLQEKVVKGHSPTLERKLEIPDTDIFSNKMFQEEAQSPVVTKPVYSKTPDDSSYMEYSPGFEVTKSPSFEFKKRPSEYMEIDLPAKSDSSDYMEADFCTTPNTVKDLTGARGDKTPSGVTSTLEPVKSPLEVVKSPLRDEQKESESKFLYMDFDPALPQDVGQTVKSPVFVPALISLPKEGSIKDSKTDRRKGETDKVKGEGHESDKGKSEGQESENCGLEQRSDRLSCDKDNKSKALPSDMTGSSLTGRELEQKSCYELKSAKGQSQDSPIREGQGHVKDNVKIADKSDSIDKEVDKSDSQANVGNAQQTKDTSAKITDNKENIGQGHCKKIVEHQPSAMKGEVKECMCKADELHNIVVKDRKTIALPVETIQDEGYVDILDFSPSKTKSKECIGRKHHRSGSSSSSNSEKVRLPLEEIPCPDKVASFFVDEPFPMPETPKSYISDDSIPEIPTPEQQFSYIQDEKESFSSLGNTSPTDGKENFSRSSVKPVRSRPTSGTQIASAGQAGDGVMLRTRSASGQTMIQHGSIISRQTSVPAVPSYSPRTSQEIQTVGRGRKTSGPPNFPSASKQPLNNSMNAGTKKGLDSAVLGQELQKQNSLPSMAVPVTECSTKHATMPCPQEMQPSRHSFTNLPAAEYEQMTFPGNRLSASEPEKSSSQQQLADIPPQHEYRLHYAQLDLHGSSEGIGTDEKIRVKSRHPSSLDDLSQPSPIYTEIDHEKTANMKNSSNKDVKFTL